MKIKHLFDGGCNIGLAALVAAFATLLGRPAQADIVEQWGLGYDAPTLVAGLSVAATLVAAGSSDSNHCLSVHNGGAIAWGFNTYGELGDGATDEPTTPVAVVGLSSGVTAIACGDYHSLAVQNGAAYAWGDNIYGDVGDGSTVQRDAPVPVIGLSSGVTAVAAGQYYSLALQNGAVYAWGANFHGQLGNGTASGFSPNPTPVPVTGLSSGVTAIAAGGSFYWVNGNVPDGTTCAHCLALKNGGVYAWGTDLGDGTNNASLTPVAVTGLSSNVTAIAAGTIFSLAVRNGNVYAWGENDFGQLGDGTNAFALTPEQIDPTDLTDITAVAATWGSGYALSADGSLWDWGYNADGELGLGTTTTDYLTPQHLVPPIGYRFTSISGQGDGLSVLATLAAVPEPAGLSLLAAWGVASLSVRRKRGRGG